MIILNKKWGEHQGAGHTSTQDYILARVTVFPKSQHICSRRSELESAFYVLSLPATNTGTGAIVNHLPQGLHFAGVAKLPPAMGTANKHRYVINVLRAFYCFPAPPSKLNFASVSWPSQRLPACMKAQSDSGYRAEIVPCHFSNARNHTSLSWHWKWNARRF